MYPYNARSDQKRNPELELDRIPLSQRGCGGFYEKSVLNFDTCK